MTHPQTDSEFATLAARVTSASRATDRWARPGPLDTQVDPRVELLALDDPRFPRALRLIEDPPPYLFVRGSIGHRHDECSLAVVGSRNATAEGVRVAESVSAELASRGHSIVSGLAEGIDAAAHRGALAAHGRTIAVMGTGIDRVYPASNAKLFSRIGDHGTVISQFDLGQPPSKTTFPARNVLIAGLTRASLLVEMSERSGTRIEATIAREQRKPVLLWEPLLGRESWARRYAAETLVYFVGSIASIVDALQDGVPTT